MNHGDAGLRLRIFLHESCRYGHRPLYEHLVALARRDGLAGATVFRGIEGYGLHRHIHTARLLDASDDLPIILEIVDKPDPIRDYVAKLDELLPHGTVTLSPVHIVKYSPGEPR